MFRTIPFTSLNKLIPSSGRVSRSRFSAAYAMVVEADRYLSDGMFDVSSRSWFWAPFDLVFPGRAES